MLRITYAERDAAQWWTLQGRLAGPWAAELKTLWEKAQRERSESTTANIRVDLREVTFIDEHGENVLREMKHAGVEFVASGIDTKDVLARLDKKSKTPLRKCLYCRE